MMHHTGRFAWSLYISPNQSLKLLLHRTIHSFKSYHSYCFWTKRSVVLFAALCTSREVITIAPTASVFRRSTDSWKSEASSYCIFTHALNIELRMNWLLVNMARSNKVSLCRALESKSSRAVSEAKRGNMLMR